MCGIAGILHDDPSRLVDPSAISRMCDAIAHRGPDDSGIWTGGGAGLGHRRLSIIDLSAAAHQPMPNEDETVWLVFNGEIYNFKELRSELEVKGHRFRSRSDSEVIVHLYEEEGEACFARLDGMFAIAIWDSRNRRLLLARDRVGKKPLKYAEIDGGIAFSSELKAILAAGLIDRDVQLGDIDLFLSLGYVPAPGTAFRGIRKLPPGHFLIWENGNLRIERYWQLDFREKQELSISDWTVAVRSAVRRAVERRLIADVPLGAFLSGGIDSSIIVACMAEASSRPVETFSIGFEHEAYNELPYARSVADWCKTNHHEFLVRADDPDLLVQLAVLYEEPYGDSSSLPSYFLAREARKHVTVALSGDGGDEGFFGYDRYRRLVELERSAKWFRRIPGLRRALNAALGLDGLLSPRIVRNLDGIVGLLDPDVGVNYLWMIRHMSDREKDAYSTDVLRTAQCIPAAQVVSAWMNEPAAGSTLEDRMAFADIVGYLPGDILVKLDLATMAHGLEARAPLLDHHVLELAASAPSTIRYRNQSLKHLLKAAFATSLPHGLFDRPKKGFGIPLQEWFRGPWRELTNDVLLAGDARVGAYLDIHALRRAYAEHLSGKISRGYQLWSLLMLELWHRNVVDRTP